MSGRNKDAAARRVTENLKRAVPKVPANLAQAVNQAAANRRKPKG